MSTFQVVLVPTVVGVAANELFPKVGHRLDLVLPNSPPPFHCYDIYHLPKLPDPHSCACSVCALAARSYCPSSPMRHLQRPC